MRNLKDAGLVRELKRGKWSFYSMNRDAAGKLLAEAEDHLSVVREPVSQIQPPIRHEGR